MTRPSIRPRTALALIFAVSAAACKDPGGTGAPDGENDTDVADAAELHIAIELADEVIQVLDTTAIMAKVLDADDNQVAIAEDWENSDPGVVSLTPYDAVPGAMLVDGLAEGTSTLTATYGKQQAAAEITVGPREATCDVSATRTWSSAGVADVVDLISDGCVTDDGAYAVQVELEVVDDSAAVTFNVQSTTEGMSPRLVVRDAAGGVLLTVSGGQPRPLFLAPGTYVLELSSAEPATEGSVSYSITDNCATGFNSYNLGTASSASFTIGDGDCYDDGVWRIGWSSTEASDTYTRNDTVSGTVTVPERLSGTFTVTRRGSVRRVIPVLPRSPGGA